MLNTLVRSLFVFTVSILLCSCSKIDTAEKLAIALEKQGVRFQSIEEGATKLRRVDEIIALTGDSLRIEILRIEDETAYKTAVFAVLLRLKFDKIKKMMKKNYKMSSIKDHFWL